MYKKRMNGAKEQKYGRRHKIYKETAILEESKQMQKTDVENRRCEGTEGS